MAGTARSQGPGDRPPPGRRSALLKIYPTRAGRWLAGISTDPRSSPPGTDSYPAAGGGYALEER
jgi:hypothetical protein